MIASYPPAAIRPAGSSRPNCRANRGGGPRLSPVIIMARNAQAMQTCDGSHGRWFHLIGEGGKASRRGIRAKFGEIRGRWPRPRSIDPPHRPAPIVKPASAISAPFRTSGRITPPTISRDTLPRQRVQIAGWWDRQCRLRTGIEGGPRQGMAAAGLQRRDHRQGFVGGAGRCRDDLPRLSTRLVSVPVCRRRRR